MVNKINAIQTLQNVRNELGSYDTNREARKQEIYDLTGQYQNMTEAYKSNLFAQWEEQETDRLSALVEKAHRSALDELKTTADAAMKSRQKVIGEAGYQMQLANTLKMLEAGNLKAAELQELIYPIRSAGDAITLEYIQKQVAGDVELMAVDFTPTSENYKHIALYKEAADYLNDYTMLVTTTDKTRPYMAISQVFRKYTELFGVTPEEFTTTYGKTISPYFGNIMG